jgi:hypothetical protein
MCNVFFNPKKWENLPKFQNHNIEIKNFIKQAIACIIKIFTNFLYCRSLCNFYLKINYHVPLNPS